MSEDRFLDRVREDAKELQFQADDAMWTRLTARIRERIAAPTVAELLARWFRPIAVSLGAVAIAASAGLTMIGSSEPALTAEQAQITMAGDVYDVGE